MRNLLEQDRIFSLCKRLVQFRGVDNAAQSEVPRSAIDGSSNPCLQWNMHADRE